MWILQQCTVFKDNFNTSFTRLKLFNLWLFNNIGFLSDKLSVVKISDRLINCSAVFSSNEFGQVRTWSTRPNNNNSFIFIRWGVSIKFSMLYLQGIFFLNRFQTWNMRYKRDMVMTSSYHDGIKLFLIPYIMIIILRITNG